MNTSIEKVVNILLEFVNSDSGLKEVPSDYIICIDNPDFPQLSISLINNPSLDSTQKECFKKILAINETLLDIRNGPNDKIEEGLIESSREFIELMGLGSKLR